MSNILANHITRALNSEYRNRCTMVRVFSLMLILSFALVSNAQIYQYTNVTTGAYSSIAANMTATGLARINGTTTSPTPCSQNYTSRNFPNASGFVAANPAIQFTITPNLGYQITVTSIDAVNGKDGAGNGPNNFYFAYSLDGATWVNSAANATTNTTFAGCVGFTGVDTWNMADFSSTTVIYFRFYPYGATVLTGDHYLKLINVYGVVSPVTVMGCTTATACNFNPVATVDDGSCIAPGCMDNTACNYSATATCTGSVICTYPTCADPTACNFGICPGGPCLYVGDACDDGNAGTGPDTYQVGCGCLGPNIGTPFNGIAVKEIPIVLNPPGDIANIELYLNDPVAVAKCYRVHVCFSDPLWELQAIYSNPSTGANLTLTSSTNKFYRHPVVNTLLGSNINPVFYGVFPEFQYDSWFTINAVSNASSASLNVVETGPGPGPSDPPLPFSTWNTTAGNLDINSVSSYSGSTIINITGTPTTTGMPTGNNQVLIGQFTSDGTITGNFNLQFRKMLNAGGTIYTPVTVINETNVQFIAPASDSLCQMVQLPIELLSFNAEIINDDRVDLVWVTQTEINNELFLIERSPDGVHGWTPVNQMPGAGNSQDAIYYRSFDFNPIDGLNFYRLKQIDTNGEFSYSHTEVVEFHHQGNIQVFPNPNDGSSLRLLGNTAGLERFVIRAIDGRIAADQRIALSEETKEIQLNEFDISQGMYTIELYKIGKSTPQVEKLVIK